MTSSIPDSISFDELESLAASAFAEEISAPAPADEPTYGEKKISKGELLRLAAEFSQASIEACDDPMMHKAMLMQILSNFVDWHTRAGISMGERGEERAAVSWLRDAGKFQAAMCIIADVNVSAEDFITPMNDDSDDESESGDDGETAVA